MVRTRRGANYGGLNFFGVASGVSAVTRALQQYLENGITIYAREKISKLLWRVRYRRWVQLNPILGDILETLFAKKFISETAVERGVVGLIPLVGAGVSGSMNYMFTRKVGRVARVFYRKIPVTGWRLSTICDCLKLSLPCFVVS